MEDKIYGVNPVLEALNSEREIDKVFIQEGARHSRLAQIIAAAKKRGIRYSTVSRQKLDALSEKYDIDIRSLLAGADSKKVKPKYWIRNSDKE